VDRGVYIGGGDGIWDGIEAGVYISAPAECVRAPEVSLKGDQSSVEFDQQPL
jgi:hypothetical protein